MPARLNGLEAQYRQLNNHLDRWVFNAVATPELTADVNSEKA